jgi:hypothetical protein
VQDTIAEAAAKGCAGALVHWVPGSAVAGARVEVGTRAASVTAKIAAGEDARAEVCVRELAWWQTPSRCRAASVQGLRSASVELLAPRGANRVEVSVDITAEANRTRRMHVAKELVTR